MTCVDLKTAVRSALSISDDQIFNFTLKKSKFGDDILLLDTENSTIQNKYVAVPTIIGIENKLKGQKIENDKILLPLFVFQYTNNQKYAVFDTGDLHNYSAVEKNNIEHFEIIFETLAEYQASYLTSNKEEPLNINFDVTALFDKVTNLQQLKNFDTDTDTLKNTKIRLQAYINKFYEDKLLVRSVGCPTGNNLFVNLENKSSVILLNSEERLVPPVYDALMYIFTFSDERFRQKHFAKLIRKYFDAFAYYLHQLNSEAYSITREYIDITVRVLLPIVKFQIIIESSASEELISNALRFLKYPLINQEDVYEVIENKLKSTEYDFIDYEMTNMNVKSGHLGQYFNIDIQIINQGKPTHLTFFAKVIIPPTEFLKEIVEGGPSEKEDFFYITLMSLFREHGLEELLDFAPKCYLSRVKWMIVLDHLGNNGFVTLKLNQTLDIDGLKHVVAQLAKLAAVTLILEENLSREEGKHVRINEIYPKFEETLCIYGEESPIKKMVDKNRDSLHYLIELLPEATAQLNLPLEEKIKKFDEVFMSVFPRILTSDVFRNAIAHGDMHLGNMLFNQQKDGSISESKLVDFQILRYIPPAFDMLVFIHMNSSREIRLKHYDDLVEGFYRDIAKYLVKFGHDPENAFPKDAFYESIKYVRPACLSMAFVYSYMMKVDPEIREDLFLDQEKFTYYYENNNRELIDLVWTGTCFQEGMTSILQDITDYIIETNM